MDLESWGNLASFAKGATEGYQTQTELELKRKRDAEELRLKKEALDVDLMGKGLIKGPDGVWVNSPQSIEKQKLDSDYKRAQIASTDARAKYYGEGGNLGLQIKALDKGYEKDPLTGEFRPGKHAQAMQGLVLQKAQADVNKLSGIAPLSEAPSVAALNQQKVTEAAAKLRDEYGVEIGPKGEVIKIEGWVKPWNKEELDKIKYYREELGKEINPRTGEQKPIKGWKPKQDKQDKPKTLPATQAVNLSAGKAAIKALDDLEGIINKNKGEFGFKQGLLNKGKAFFGGKNATTARTLQSDLQTRGQILSKFLEQGKLSDKDREFYLGQVPTLTDSPDTAQNKIKTLSRIVEQLHNQNLEGFEAAGYDVGKFSNLPMTSIRELKSEKMSASDQEKIDLAKKALSSKGATSAQKENAKLFLKSKGAL